MSEQLKKNGCLLNPGEISILLHKRGDVKRASVLDGYIDSFARLDINVWREMGIQDQDQLLGIVDEEFLLYCGLEIGQENWQELEFNKKKLLLGDADDAGFIFVKRYFGVRLVRATLQLKQELTEDTAASV